MKKSSNVILRIDILLTLITGFMMIFNLNVNSKKLKIVDNLEYEYNDDGIPGTSYVVKLNYDSKVLYVETTYHSSAIDVKQSVYKNTITLTDDEIEKIRNITKNKNYNKDYLSGALSSLVLGDKIMSKKGEDVLWDESNERADLNNDGIVTEREFGNDFLNMILEEE